MTAHAAGHPLPLSMTEAGLQHSLAHSYRDFHAKGVDYVCLTRSDFMTTKLYFFEGDVSKLPEVVYPHDHRYDFVTYVLSGAVENTNYAEDAERGDGFNQFAWRTPLNGGNGFTFHRQAWLRISERALYRRDEAYWLRVPEIHTIRIVEDQTILLLTQFADTVPIGEPTRTFSRGDAPSTDGFYRRFTPDELLARLRLVESVRARRSS